MIQEILSLVFFVIVANSDPFFCGILGTSEMLDLLNNALEGEIPLGLGQFERALVLLDGNANM